MQKPEGDVKLKTSHEEDDAAPATRRSGSLG